MDLLAVTPISGLGPAWTVVIAVILAGALLAGTVWADRIDRENPR
jgi:hypothetical protein